ncbi:MAG: hypothetical protein NTW62_03780 [Candidatus Nomurabacteria bacterium]|nr:hypothetical protein [Candidatus Nomurabacteria bacterium]
MNNITGLKIGGSNLRDLESVKNIGNILKERNIERPYFIVVSAMYGMTRLLEKIHNANIEKNKTGKKLEMVKFYNEFIDFHENIMNGLFAGKNPKASFRKLIEDFDETIMTAGFFSEALVKAEILSFGERFSSLILSNYLNSQNINNTLIRAFDFMVTSNDFDNSIVCSEKTNQNIINQFTNLMQKNGIVITEGFIGRTKINGNPYYTNPGGWNGSDYTAKIIADALDAKKLIFYKDTFLMDVNPNEPGGEKAKKINSISYENLRAKILDKSAGTILHEKVLLGKRIPIEIRSSLNPKEEGTKVF